ncbi:MarR family transcriptional regulator [uncultured Methanobacterium sp.]|uniref:HVO_A0114 family putative DNA-binding protein n=1 Tax=uncultured Methanobacterium sp. TaxID=176306 RepID=UPI002AA89074|nr:MarR family transcriptional regulator [uncultured Methanobacterium sp.]
MIIKLVRQMNGSELVEMLKEKYGSMDNLKRLMEKDTENVLYPLDLEDWLYHLEHPAAEVKQSETIFIKDLKINMSDLKMLDIIKNQHPTSIRNLSCILHKDLKTVQPRVHRLAEEGFIKLEPGPKNAKKPVVNFNKIEIEI